MTKRMLRGLSVLVLMAVIACGCASRNKVTGDSLAGVAVTNQPPLEIAKALTKAFEEEGFVLMPAVAQQSSRSDYRLIFEKQAGAGDTILYGDWSLKRNWLRAKARITRQEARRSLVICDAFRVVNRGDGHFEDERKLSRTSAAYYQKILERAASQLAPSRIESAPRL